MFEPISPPAESIHALFVLVLAITAAIFLLVQGLLLYCLVRYRHRDDAPHSEPPQVYGSKPIELAWTAVPGLIVFVLVLVVIRTELEVRADPRQPPEGAVPLRVRVIGHQWWWEYVYEEYDGRRLDFITANELHVPASDDTARPVYLALESADVCHSFWVPRLAGKMDLIPGRTNPLWFQTDVLGLHVGQCAEYCGTQHANMLLRVVVQEPEEFEAWLARQQQPAADDARVAAGREAFLRQSCVNCHTVAGSRAVGRVGPDLTHVGSRSTLASGMIANTPANLKRWIRDPQEVKPGCLMPAFRLEESELDAIVAWLSSLE
jgi:cytochrome c oxidase subunit 2